MKHRHTVVVAAASTIVGVLLFAPAPAAPPAAAAGGLLSPGSIELAKIRLEADPSGIDAFVAEQRARAEAAPEDEAEWRVLAEAYLERCYARDRGEGMAVGTPTHSELPAVTEADIDAGLKALDRAHAVGGDQDAEVFRIEAAFHSLRVTSWTSALSQRPAISAALEKARSLRPDHPRVLVAMGCEKLFAPRFFGNDPATAKQLFLTAADALPLDERPLVFAAMAAHLLEKDDEAIALLERAVERNPNNRYAATVLARLRAAESEPFARDVTAPRER